MYNLLAGLVISGRTIVPFLFICMIWLLSAFVCNCCIKTCEGVIEETSFGVSFLALLSFITGDGDLERVFERFVDFEGDFERFFDLDLLLLFLRLRFFFLLDRDLDRRLLFFLRDLLLDRRRFLR